MITAYNCISLTSGGETEKGKERNCINTRETDAYGNKTTIVNINYNNIPMNNKKNTNQNMYCKLNLSDLEVAKLDDYIRDTLKSKERIKESNS